MPTFKAIICNKTESAYTAEIQTVDDQSLVTTGDKDVLVKVAYSTINFKGGKSVSARPSDAIALALRTGSPILGSEQLLKDAGIEIPDQAEDEVEKFKEFLEGINPEDFRA